MIGTATAPHLTVVMTNEIAYDAAREANHRIANNLSIVAGSLRMQARAIDENVAPMQPEDVRAMLDQVAARIDAVALLHRALSKQPDCAHIDLGKQLRIVCDALVAAHAQRGEIEITYDLHACTASPNRATTISLLVTELVTNAIKYAHPTGITTAIVVACRNVNGDLEIAVTDDGVGLPVNVNPETANTVGLQVIRALSRSLGAKLTFEDGGLGLTVRLRIPG